VIRDAFLDSARQVRDLIASEPVRASWDAPSALAEMTVGALAGHTARAILLPEQYLDQPAPAPGTPLLTASGYFTGVPLSTDVTDELNIQIRERGATEAADGVDALVARIDAALERTERRLATEPADRTVSSFGGKASLLDEYLVTRIVELAVHADDLAVSIAVDAPDLSPTAWACALGCLFQIARERHGDASVLRALARRERDSVEALRVL
jgi:hypothetical protein